MGGKGMRLKSGRSGEDIIRMLFLDAGLESVSGRVSELRSKDWTA